MPLLDDLQGKWAGKTAHGGEVLFLRGVAEVALLRHKEATDSLTKFLADVSRRSRADAGRSLPPTGAAQAVSTKGR